MTFNDYNQSLLPPAAAGSPGRFEIGKIYKITRGTWGDCYGWNAFSLIIGYSRAAKTVKSFPEEEVKKNKKLLDQILK